MAGDIHDTFRRCWCDRAHGTDAVWQESWAEGRNERTLQHRLISDALLARTIAALQKAARRRHLVDAPHSHLVAFDACGDLDCVEARAVLAELEGGLR